MNRRELKSMKRLAKQLRRMFPKPKKAIKCKTCKCRFYPTKALRKTVVERRYGQADNQFDAYDCPACGRQTIMGKRYQEEKVL